MTAAKSSAARKTTALGTRTSLLPGAELGSCFCTVAVAVLADSVQLAVPQLYPDGQHPGTAPASPPHRNQPDAHVELAAALPAASASVTATTIVAPFDTIVVMAGAGHDVVLQSRPVRQQPPPALATHA